MSTLFQDNRTTQELFDPFHLKLNPSNSLVESKERDSMINILANLNDQQKVDAMNYINQLHQLKPMADSLRAQTQTFRAHLEETNNYEEVKKIEAQIIKMDNECRAYLEQFISYPQDEMVASELIDFLKINKHLLDVLQSFDLHELLTEDIENALSMHSSIRARL